jgi:hypothetical protein
LCFGFFCDNALPATLFEVLLNRASRRTFEASEATFLLVDFALAMPRLLPSTNERPVDLHHAPHHQANGSLSVA